MLNHYISVLLVQMLIQTCVEENLKKKETWTPTTEHFESFFSLIIGNSHFEQLDAFVKSFCE